jgi:hypothetical protein
VPDEALPDFLAEASQERQRVVIAEVMDRRWRRQGNPPVFNRDAETYIYMMQELGFKLAAYAKYEYERYNSPPWNVGRDSRITFLTFDRK